MYVVYVHVVRTMCYSESGCLLKEQMGKREGDKLTYQHYHSYRCGALNDIHVHVVVHNTCVMNLYSDLYPSLY